MRAKLSGNKKARFYLIFFVGCLYEGKAWEG